MKRWIHTSTDYLSRIPKKYKEHIELIEVTDSDDYNDRGQRLKNYTVTWDNGDEQTFQNLEYMIWAIKENTVDGYYVSP